MDDDDVIRPGHTTTNGGDAQVPFVGDQINVADEEEHTFYSGAMLSETGGEFLIEEFLAITKDLTADISDLKHTNGHDKKWNQYQQRYANKEASIAEIEAAVDVIPNDDVFLWKQSGWGSWDAWNNFGMALHAATDGSNDGLRLYHKWSEKHPSYNATHTDDNWQKIKGSPPKSIGAGSIFFWADQADPKWRKIFSLDALPASQYFGERPAPIPPALIKGLLPQTGVATIGGQSGTGKSFHAIHLGVRLIPDCKEHYYIDRYPIRRKGGVLYLVLEGKPAFPIRVAAEFEQCLKRQLEYGDRYKMPFCWNFYAPNLFDKGPDNLLRLASREQETMRKEFGVDLVAIFLDTLGLAACFENENMAAQVQRVIAGLGRVSDETGALCINVDHMGKDTDAGMRGTSAKRDCVETILGCFADRENGDRPTNHRMQLLKVRDGEEGRVIPYRLEQVNMGFDEEGDQVSTAVIRWEPNRQWKLKGGRPRKGGGSTDVNLEAAIKAVGGLPVDMFTLRKAYYEAHGGKQHAANAAWNRAIKDLGLTLGEDGRLYEK